MERLLPAPFPLPLLLPLISLMTPPARSRDFFYPPAIKREREGCVGRKLPKDSLSSTALSQKERDFMGGLGLPIYRILPFFFWVGNLSMWRLFSGGPNPHFVSRFNAHKTFHRNTFEATLCLLPSSPADRQGATACC